MALLVGVMTGVAIAVAAGARRTGSVVDRAQRAQRPPNVYMVPAYSLHSDVLRFDPIAAFPEVAESFRVPLPFGVVDGERRPIQVLPQALVGPGRMRPIAGRLPRGQSEAAVNFLARDAYGWKPGTDVTVKFLEHGVDGTVGNPEPSGPAITFRVTGVLATLGDLGGNAEPALMLPESFWAAHAEQISAIDLFMFRLHRGPGDYATFHRHVSELTKGEEVFYVEGEAVLQQARRSFQMQSTGLWVLCAFLAVTALLVLTQLLVRLTAIESTEHGALRALGFRSRNLVVLGLVRLTGLVAIGTAFAGVVAVALSPLFPIGRPRLVEPDPGLLIDSTVIALGVALAAVLLVAGCAGPIWVAARRVGSDAATRSASVVVAGFSRALRGPNGTIGAHLALVRGRGRSAVPVRSSVACAALSVATVVTALVVAASLHHLLVTPRLYGWNWDLIVVNDGGVDMTRLASVPEVATFSAGVEGESGTVILAGRQVALTAIDPAGGVAPPVATGRLPQRDDEVALGARSLRQAHVHMGDMVTTRISGSETEAAFRVVGTVVLPFTGDVTSLGEGAYITHAGARRLDPEIPADTAFVRLHRGVSDESGVRALQEAFPDGEVSGTQKPTTVLDFGRVTGLPLAIAGIVAALAAATFGHVIVSAVHSRRRELAVLKAVGLGRRGVRAAVAWQATILVGLALVVGVPLGLVAGRGLWGAFADLYGFVPAPVLPFGQLAIVVLAAVALANLVAALPAWSAARTSVAATLRLE